MGYFALTKSIIPNKYKCQVDCKTSIVKQLNKKKSKLNFQPSIEIYEKPFTIPNSLWYYL